MRYGEWALIAGAAEGIGAGFSEALARRGMNLVMADRNEKAMERLGLRIGETYKVNIRTVHVDMETSGAWKICIHAVSDIDCRMMVYVAAFTRVKPFLENSHDELERYIRVNNLTALHIIHGFAGPLRDRGKTGGIFLVSSLSGIIAPPLVAVYSGTKGFLLRFAESLRQELAPKGIDVGVCAAGITDTPTYNSSRPEKAFFTPAAMNPLKVAEYAIEKLGKGTISIPGLKNRMIYFILTRFLPRNMAVRIVGRQMIRMYGRGK